MVGLKPLIYSSYSFNIGSNKILDSLIWLELFSDSAKPLVSRPLENLTVHVNTPIELVCDFKLGEPKATISWYVVVGRSSLDNFAYIG